jgi:hypothetical protein
MTLRPDPTFHPTAQLAMQAPVETYGVTVMLSPEGVRRRMIWNRQRDIGLKGCGFP